MGSAQQLEEGSAFVLGTQSGTRSVEASVEALEHAWAAPRASQRAPALGPLMELPWEREKACQK